MTTIDSAYFRNALRQLREEYDRQLQADGDQLKHARALDILTAVAHRYDVALSLGRKTRVDA